MPQRQRPAGAVIALLLVIPFVLLAGAALLLLVRAAARPRAVVAANARPGGAVRFVDAAARAGITFRYANGRKGIATILEESGSGCALFDYDGDGWLDVYLLNGRDLYNRAGSPPTPNALYRNNRDGTFSDVTEKAGVPGTGYGLGVAAADYDNDGHADLYVCQWGKNVLYKNNGDGTFSDVTKKAGVGALDDGASFHTGAAWLDYDGDGRLDLFACGYVRFRLNGLRYCKLATGVLSNCPPQIYDGAPSILFHNKGDGTFANVTKKAGVFFPKGKALSALTGDVDGDGRTDLIVGNDGEEAWLLHNKGDGTFTNQATLAGIAFGQDGATMAAMGIDLGDFLNEGRPGFFVADFSKRPDHLWRNLGANTFLEVSAPSRVGDLGFPYLGFGAGFLDYDNDGWLDIFIANGHVYPEIDTDGAGDERYQQRNQLFHNQRDGTYRETTDQAGPAFALKHAGRGAAFGDVDNDGRVDVLVSNNDGLPVLVQSENGASVGHFVSFRLVGTRSNRDAIGARVWVTAAGPGAPPRQMRDIKSGGSYLSSSDLRAHFGLGPATQISHVEVRWPSGVKQSWKALPADRFYVLREGTPHAAEAEKGARP